MKITVRYWRGTAEKTAVTNSYKGAMRIAALNQNAYDPTFWSESGERLHDDGVGLMEESEMTKEFQTYYVVNPEALAR